MCNQIFELRFSSGETRIVSETLELDKHTQSFVIDLLGDLIKRKGAWPGVDDKIVEIVCLGFLPPHAESRFRGWGVSAQMQAAQKEAFNSETCTFVEARRLHRHLSKDRTAASNCAKEGRWQYQSTSYWNSQVW